MQAKAKICVCFNLLRGSVWWDVLNTQLGEDEEENVVVVVHLLLCNSLAVRIFA